MIDDEGVFGLRFVDDPDPSGDLRWDGDAHDDVSPGGRTGVLDTEALEVVHEALDRIVDVLGESGDDPAPTDGPSTPPDRGTVARSLRRGWDGAATEARALAAAAPDSERLGSLIDLLNVVYTAAEFLARSPSTGPPMSRVRERLRALSTAGSLDEMIDRIPVAVSELGFDRVLLSRIESSRWMPERLYFKGNARWADEVLTTLSREPLLLDTSLLETQMVRRAVPLRVVDPVHRPLMNRLMVTASLTRGYVAAPITHDGVVVGFLHADCYYQGRMPSEDDVETLWLFSGALGPMLAQKGLSEHVAHLRRQIENPVPVFGNRGPRVVSDSEVRPPRRPRTQAGEPPRRDHALHEVVTTREADVLRLLSEGARNDQIAHQLGISLGTVKSHVKRILRKLDVGNRSEAASLWLRSEYWHMSTTPPGPALTRSRARSTGPGRDSTGHGGHS